LRLSISMATYFIEQEGSAVLQSVGIEAGGG
jgi:hypothetical protein